MIKVLIVDDQKLIREGLQMMLSFYEDISVIGEARNGKEAIEILEREKTDILLMDIRMPVMDGVEATGIIKKMYPDIKVLVLTTFDEDEYIFPALESGADGYLLKDISSDQLVNAIKTVYKGNVLLQPNIAKKIFKNMERKNHMKENLHSLLTKKEYEISLLIAQGKSNKEIASLLYITEGTVKNHVTNILGKLNLRDRTQLALRVMK